MFALALLVVAQLADAPAPAAAREKLLVLDVAGDEAVEERRGIADALATLLLERSDVDVASASAVRDRLQLSANRAEAGCDDGGCATEAADAIGARYVLLSRLTSLEGTRTLRLELFDGQQARTASLVVLKGESLSALVAELPRAVDELVERSDGALPRRDAPAPVIEAPGFFDRPGNLALVAGGAVLAVGALAGVGWGVPAYLGAQRERAVDDAAAAYLDEPSVANARDVVEARDAVDDVRPFQLLASPLFLLAGTALVGGAALVVAGVAAEGP